MQEEVFESQREKLLSDLILSDIGTYRRLGVLKGQGFFREPTHYYLDLKKIYDQLSTKSIQKLLEIKPKLELKDCRNKSLK